MNNTLKIILLNLLLLAPCAIEGMGSLRNFSTRMMSLAHAMKSGFKHSYQKKFKTFSQKMLKPCIGKSNFLYAYTKLAAPLVSAGVISVELGQQKQEFGKKIDSALHEPRAIAEVIKNCQSDAQKSELLQYIDLHPATIPLFVQAAIELTNIPETWWLMKEIEQRNAQAIEPWTNALFKAIMNVTETNDEFTPELLYIVYGTLGETNDLKEKMKNPTPIMQWARKHMYQAFTPIYHEIALTLQRLLKDISAHHDLTTTTQSHAVWEIEQFKDIEKQGDREALARIWDVVNHKVRGGRPNDRTIHAVVARYKQHKEIVTELLKSAYQSEVQATIDGYYTFYHAQAWKSHLVQDFYKALFNSSHESDKKMKPEFIPLRVPAKVGPTYAIVRKEDALFCNASILGNVGLEGESTFEYLTGNDSVADLDEMESLFEICKALGISHASYEKDLEQLHQLHSQANHVGLGNLLQVVVPKNALSTLVKAATPGPGEHHAISVGDEKTDDIERIMHAVRHEPHLLNRSEKTVYTIPLTQAVLAQETGHKIYQFNAADQNKLKEYEEYRDLLISKMMLEKLQQS